MQLGRRREYANFHVLVGASNYYLSIGYYKSMFNIPEQIFLGQAWKQQVVVEIYAIAIFNRIIKLFLNMNFALLTST